MNKQNFLNSLLFRATLLVTVKAKSFSEELPAVWTTDDKLAQWKSLRNDYKLKPDPINLQNGYYSIMAQPVFRRLS